MNTRLRRRDLRRLRKRAARSLETTGRRLVATLANYKQRAAKFVGLSNKALECDRLVERMTNWQRNQWARAGYPRDLDTIHEYAMRVRP